MVHIDEIAEKAASFPAKSIVVTGGEPMNYNLDKLCMLLKKKNITSYLETSGTHPMTGIWDWICLSPKRQSPPEKEFYNKAKELKVIIYEDLDFDWAEKNAKLVAGNCMLYLQPEWSRLKTMIPAIIEYIKQRPQWRISLQSHKYMGIP